MPSWTLGELSSQVTRSLGRRADMAASDVSFWINQAYHMVTEVTPHALQERIAVASTVSGENRLQLPADLRELRTLSYLTNAGNSRRTLRQMNPHEFDARFQFNTYGTPEYYVLYNDFMELYPSPNSDWSIQMRYLSEATDLVETGDVPSISTSWRYAVYLKAKELVLGEYYGRQDEAALARNEFESYVLTIPSDTERRQRAHDRPAFTLAGFGHPKR